MACQPSGRGFIEETYSPAFELLQDYAFLLGGPIILPLPLPYLSMARGKRKLPVYRDNDGDEHPEIPHARLVLASQDGLRTWMTPRSPQKTPVERAVPLRNQDLSSLDFEWEGLGDFGEGNSDGEDLSPPEIVYGVGARRYRASVSLFTASTNIVD